MVMLIGMTSPPNEIILFQLFRMLRQPIQLRWRDFDISGDIVQPFAHGADDADILARDTGNHIAFTVIDNSPKDNALELRSRLGT